MKRLSIIYLTTIILFLSTLFVLAEKDRTGVVIDTGNSGFTLMPGIFAPSVFTNIMQFGILRFAAYIATFFTGFIILTVIFSLIRSSFYLIANIKNDPGFMAKEVDSIKHLWIGFFATLGMSLVYICISLIIGSGNIFYWVNKLGQCGDKGIFLFKAEYLAASEDPYFFDNANINIYCCTGGYPGSGTQGMAKGKEDGIWTYPSGQSSKTHVIVGSESSGWILMKDNTTDACIGYEISNQS